MTHPLRALLVASLTIVIWTPATIGSSGVSAEAEAPEAQEQAKYLRVSEDVGRQITLEIASVDLLPAEGPGPRIGLIGVAHVGEAAFYRNVQLLLDDYDIVLFEAIRPPGAGGSGSQHEDPAKQAQSTRASMRFVASAIEAYRTVRNRYPDDEQALLDFARRHQSILANWLRIALVDAWDMPIAYEPKENGKGFRLTSYGADGKPGGDEFDADITLTQRDGVSPLDVEQDNLQQQLADALGLEYQLRALAYDRPNWRSSDMNIEQFNRELAARGVDFALVGNTLGGTSFPAQLARGLLRLVSLLDAMAQGAVSDTIKVMLIEMLGDESAVEMSMTQLGEGFAEVILDKRNQVVIDDLKSILRDEPEVESIAVLYGAAHTADFVERLSDQIDYKPVETTWLAAITVDLEKSQVDANQLQRMRMVIRRMVQQQTPRTAR